MPRRRSYSSRFSGLKEKKAKKPFLNDIDHVHHFWSFVIRKIWSATQTQARHFPVLGFSLLPTTFTMLRQAARRCAQARRPLSRPLMPLRAWIHSSAGSSRQPISSREVLLGTSAAALGFGIWRYLAGPSDVFLDAEGERERYCGATLLNHLLRYTYQAEA